MPEIKKVSTGDPVKINAQTFNTMMDVVRGQKCQFITSDRLRYGNLPGAHYVKNTTASDLVRFSVLGYNGVLYNSNDNLHEFVNNHCILGTTPAAGTHEGNFIILAEPIKAGKIGRGWSTGISPALIYVTNDNKDYNYAEIINADTGKLNLVPNGSAQIIWKDTSGTLPGNRMALIKMNVQSSASGNLLAKTQEAAQADGKISVKLLDSAGAETGSAFDVYAFPDKAGNDMTLYLPAIASAATVIITKIYSDYFLIWPTLIKVGTSTDDVTSTAITTGGRLINNFFGKW